MFKFSYFLSFAKNIDSEPKSFDFAQLKIERFQSKRKYEVRLTKADNSRKPFSELILKRKTVRSN